MSKKEQEQFNQMLKEMRQYVEDTEASLSKSRDSVTRLQDRCEALKSDRVAKQNPIIKTEVKEANSVTKKAIKATTVAPMQNAAEIETSSAKVQKEVFNPLAPVSVKVTSFGVKKDQDVAIKTTRISTQKKAQATVKSTKVKVEKKPYNESSKG